MKRIARFLHLVIAALITTAANAYELATHGMMTQNAYQESQLHKDPQLLKGLGLDPTNLNPFGEIHYDVSGAEVKERQQNDFEKLKMPDRGVNFLTIAGWLLRGAIREDDWTGINIPGCQVTAENPQDDPYDQDPDCPLNHFYDPVRNIPLTLIPVLGPITALGQRAPDWALGSTDAFDEPNTSDPARRNHFTVFDARVARYTGTMERSLA